VWRARWQGGFDLERKKAKHGSVVEQQRDDTAVSYDAPDWFKTEALVRARGASTRREHKKAVHRRGGGGWLG